MSLVVVVVADDDDDEAVEDASLKDYKRAWGINNKDNQPNQHYK